jgi:hypothetical protein
MFLFAVFPKTEFSTAFLAYIKHSVNGNLSFLLISSLYVAAE